MSNLLAAAAIRKRDATIAEEKKFAREREEEGDEFADKEKFVTSAYKKQQEENRRLEEEERIKEELEAKKNKGGGMTIFYKNMLEKGEQKHAEVVKAAEEAIKNGPTEAIEEEKTKTEAEIAREINEKTGGNIARGGGGGGGGMTRGQVVDKRQLLKGGLNVVAKPKAAATANSSRDAASMSDRTRGYGAVGAGGGKQAMRERQSRMMEAQLEQITKRALEEDEEERAKVERASKSQKTEGEYHECEGEISPEKEGGGGSKEERRRMTRSRQLGRYRLANRYLQQSGCLHRHTLFCQSSGQTDRKV